ncbi:alpha-glucan family phosphorylase [Candidatus Saccharibacteria bacterium]|nr:alpha-glucan family phosphorylase [Candidatus Saccharibacteria bacterium]
MEEKTLLSSRPEPQKVDPALEPQKVAPVPELERVAPPTAYKKVAPGIEPGLLHPLDNIEDVDDFYAAINREHLQKALSPERPYTYWTIELYDKKNGIRGGGGLGVLAADTRRVAEQMNVPLTLITPFYPSEQHQKCSINDNNGFSFQNQTESIPVDYKNYGFTFLDTVNIKANKGLVKLDVVEKVLGSTRLLCITEPGFGELYSGDSGGDHRLYQEVALGFGGYQALKLAGLKPAIMQLNEVATFFAALARLDELASNGMDFYEAVVYTRKHTLYTNHTLVQAAEATFNYAQFERYVFPNLKSSAVKKWLSDKFDNGYIKLSTVTIEIAELRSGVSKLHARVANYREISGKKVKFKAVTNGIDIPTWTAKPAVDYLKEKQILDKFFLPTADYVENLEALTAEDVKKIKLAGRVELNTVLERRVDQYGNPVHIPEDALLFEFKRRFVDYKRPWLPFTDPIRLKNILEKYNAHYILSGRVHEGDFTMTGRLAGVLETIDKDPVLKARVHYLPDYDEELGRALSVGANISINTPIVGLEACGTSWMKDIVNFGILVSTHDGGVADCPADSYLNISGETEAEEVESLYERMDEAAAAWNNAFELESILKTELKNFLPVISGTRMLKDYLEYLFPEKS